MTACDRPMQHPPSRHLDVIVEPRSRQVVESRRRHNSDNVQPGRRHLDVIVEPRQHRTNDIVEPRIQQEPRRHQNADNSEPQRHHVDNVELRRHRSSDVVEPRRRHRRHRKHSYDSRDSRRSVRFAALEIIHEASLDKGTGRRIISD